VCVAIGISARGLRSAPLQAEPPAVKKEEPQEPRAFAVTGKVSSLAWGRDGLATIGYREPKEGVRIGNNTVQFWDAQTGKEKLSLGEEAQTQLSQPIYSPDGKLLALSSFKWEDNRRITLVKVYDPARGQLVREIESHEIGSWLAFSPDGKTLATAGQKFEPFRGEFERIVAEVKLWDVATGKMKRLLEVKRELDYFNTFGDLAFSPDGKTLATPGVRFEYTRDMVPDKPDLNNPIGSPPQSHKEVVLWDVDAGKVKRILKGESSYYFSVAFSPDGKSLITSDQDGEVRVWDAATGKVERKFTHDRAPWAVLSPDGKWLATVGGPVKDGKRHWSVKLWDYRTGEEKQTIPSQEGLTSAICFSPDSKRLAVGVESTVRIWDIEKAEFEK
jgi:WD40 repeat protein